MKFSIINVLNLSDKFSENQTNVDYISQNTVNIVKSSTNLRNILQILAIF